MADLWQAYAPSVIYAVSVTDKSALDVTNGSTKVVRAYRMWHFDIGPTANNGGFIEMHIARFSTSAVGYSNTPVRSRDSNAALLPHGISAGSTRIESTSVTEELFRSYMRCTDEWLTTDSSNIDVWELEVPLSLVWDAGYRDSTIEPIVLRKSCGVHIRQQTGATANAAADYEIEFTVGDS